MKVFAVEEVNIEELRKEAKKIEKKLKKFQGLREEVKSFSKKLKAAAELAANPEDEEWALEELDLLGKLAGKPRYFTVEEFAQYFRVSRSTAWRWIRRKQPRLARPVKVIKPGKRYLIPWDEIEKLEKIAEISRE